MPVSWAIRRVTADVCHSYANKAALKAHGETDEFKTFYKTLVDEDLVDGATQLKFVKPVTGFISRL